MSSIYDAVATRALGTITKKGAPVIFTAGTAPIYSPIDDTWTGGTLGPVTGQAVQIPDDPTQFAALGLVLVDPVTLMVAAKGLACTPTPGMPMLWAGVTYAVKYAEAVAPDGTPILWTVVGSRG